MKKLIHFYFSSVRHFNILNIKTHLKISNRLMSISLTNSLNYRQEIILFTKSDYILKQ